MCVEANTLSAVDTANVLYRVSLSYSKFFIVILHIAQSQNTTRTGDETTVCREWGWWMTSIVINTRCIAMFTNTREWEIIITYYYHVIIELSSVYTSVLHYYYYYVLYVLCVVRCTHITRNGARFLHKEIVNVITASIGYAAAAAAAAAAGRPTDRLANLTDRRRTLYRARRMRALRNLRRPHVKNHNNIILYARAWKTTL